MGPLTRKITTLQQEKDSYMQQARSDIESRRAAHNAQLQNYDREIKPLKRQAWTKSMRMKFQEFGQSVGKMGPM